MSSPHPTTAPDPVADGIPLSFNHEFVCLFDQGDDVGPLGPRYHIMHGWRLRGEVDPAVLRSALDDVVARHEALRTVLVRGDAGRHQRVLPASSPPLEVRDLTGTAPADRDRRIDELLNEIEAGEIDARRPPLLRATLARFAADDAVLVLLVHHTAIDGWSMRTLIRDLATCYALRSGQPGPGFPEAAQYREFAVWQRAFADGPTLDHARDFWREGLRDAQVFVLPTDRLRAAGTGAPTTSVHRFAVDAELAGRALAAGRKARCTSFMVLFAVFELLAHRITGGTDLVIPTFTPGRHGQDRFEHAVGSFFNFLPLRVDLNGCRTFRDLLDRTRETCAASYANDIPTMEIFDAAPQLMAPAMREDAAPCVFQVFPFPNLLDGERVGPLEYTEIRRRLTSQPLGSDVPDGSLWTLNIDPGGELIGSVQFKHQLYDAGTIEGWVREYVTLLRAAVNTPDAPLPVR